LVDSSACGISIEVISYFTLEVGEYFDGVGGISFVFDGISSFVDIVFFVDLVNADFI